MNNTIFSSDRVLSKELFNTFTSVNIGGDAGVITSLATIDCRGYNYLEFDVRALGTNGKVWIQKTINNANYIDSKIWFVYNASNSRNAHKIVDGIFESGKYILDVSDAISVQFVRKETVPTANITVDIARLSTQVDILPKIVQISTDIVTCTSSSIKVALSRIDISAFRFIIIRIKTVPQTGESSTVRESASISINYLFNGAVYKDYVFYLENNILTLDNYYVAVSDWIMPKSDIINVSVTAPDATTETPKSFEITLMGVR